MKGKRRVLERVGWISRLLRPALTGCLFAVVPAEINAAEIPDLTGTWQGAYDCVQGKTSLTLTFAPDGKGGFVGEFAFFAAKDNPGVPTGSFGVTALYDRTAGSFNVDPRLWIVQPDGYVTVPLVGEVSEDGQAFAGEVLTQGCGTFLVKRFVS